jgi:thiosulfate/3-mercaptopyruvate sulfurtransferase
MKKFACCGSSGKAVSVTRSLKFLDMKKTSFNLRSIILLALFAFALQACSAGNGGDDPWTAKQLMEPSDLADVLNQPDSPQPYIFCIGPQAIIPNSIDIGPAGNKANLEKFRKELKELPKDADIVIYCGCCPFSRCPNVRPAFKLLNEMKFTNQKLLNLKQNIKVDWIDQGYPLNK